MKLARPRISRLRRRALAAFAALGATAAVVAPAGYGLSAYQHALGPATAPGASSAPVDIPPPQAMAQACAPRSTVLSCDHATLDAIDAARQSEGLGPLALPSGYEDMSFVSQLVAVTNAERTSRNLPALQGPRVAFDLMAELGAARSSDPSGPAGATWASLMAAGYWTPLQADYQWMYNDGPGGTNTDCTASQTAACWAHRDSILSPWPGSIGAAARRAGAPDRLVFTELIVKKP